MESRASARRAAGALLGRCEPRDGTLLARLTFEILRPVPVGEVGVAARVLRPGRSVQLLEGELTAGGEPVVTVRAWRVNVNGGWVGRLAVQRGQWSLVGAGCGRLSVVAAHKWTTAGRRRGAWPVVYPWRCKTRHALV